MIQQDFYTTQLVLDSMETQKKERARQAQRRGTTPRLPTASRIAVAALFFVNGALIGNWVARIPAIKAGLGLNDGVFGLALLAMAGGALVAMPLAGGLSARFGSHRVTQYLTIL